MEMRRQATCFKATFDLWAGTVDQHQANAQAVQQHQVMNDVAEVRVLNAVARKHDDEGAIPVGIDIGGRVAEPIDVIGHIRKSL
jgi:hypothetical protein